MNKQELVSIWRKLDKACEAVEQLNESGMSDPDTFQRMAGLKHSVELQIEDRTAEGTKLPWD
jgi:hypothetical protein